MTTTRILRRAPYSWDVALTVFLVVLMVVLAVIALIIGLGLGFSATACAEGAVCAESPVQWGIWIAAFGPAIAALAMTIICVVRLAKRRIAFGVALLGLGLMVCIIMVGIILFDSGVPWETADLQVRGGSIPTPPRSRLKP